MGISWVTMGAVLLGLLVFGLLYNWLVGWLEANGHDRGYTAFLVVGGTAVTLVGAALKEMLKDHQKLPSTVIFMIARASAALGENLEAIRELEQIAGIVSESSED